jgi:hypothetical protein
MVGIKDWFEGGRRNNEEVRERALFSFLKLDVLRRKTKQITVVGWAWRYKYLGWPNGYLRAALLLSYGCHCRPSQSS